MVGAADGEFCLRYSEHAVTFKEIRLRSQGINYTNALDLDVLSDSDAQFHGICRNAPESDATHLNIGPLGFLNKLNGIIPEQLP